MMSFDILIDGRHFRVELEPQPGPDGSFEVRVGDSLRRVSLAPAAEPGGLALALVDGRPYELALEPELAWMQTARERHSVELHDVAPAARRPRSGDGRIKAPIPGAIARVLVEPGQAVAAGQPLLVLEAMKMQNEICATRDGVLSGLYVRPGQTVGLHELIAEVS